jgi:hypothetical protein
LKTALKMLTALSKADDVSALIRNWEMTGQSFHHRNISSEKDILTEDDESSSDNTENTDNSDNNDNNGNNGNNGNVDNMDSVVPDTGLHMSGNTTTLAMLQKLEWKKLKKEKMKEKRRIKRAAWNNEGREAQRLAIAKRRGQSATITGKDNNPGDAAVKE